jgi:hypothetical protein
VRYRRASAYAATVLRSPLARYGATARLALLHAYSLLGAAHVRHGSRGLLAWAVALARNGRTSLTLTVTDTHLTGRTDFPTCPFPVRKVNRRPVAGLLASSVLARGVGCAADWF